MSDDAAARKAQTKAQFNALAPDYDSGPGCFAYYGRRLVEAAGVAPGQRVLDVASGRGAVLFPSAERAGRTGEVVGVDFAEQMARVTNEEAVRRGLAARVRVIRDRLSDMPNMMKLNSDDFGHKIILAASISDVFGAATFDDFDRAFRALDITVSDSEIRRMLFCGHAVGWLTLAQRGHQKFYLPNFETGACDFTYKSSAHQRDTTRWKRDIRAHWNEHDKLRSRVILDHPRETASS